MMSIRIAAASLAVGLAVCATPQSASAQANVMKECGAEYQAAKAANTLGGKTWKDFLAECRTRHAASAPAPASAASPPAAPAATPAPPAATPAAPAATAAAPSAPTGQASAKKTSGGREAMLARQRACAAEWKSQKAELRKTTPDLKWPKFWSGCNKRLKAQGQ
jgi:hypothetical protein